MANGNESPGDGSHIHIFNSFSGASVEGKLTWNCWNLEENQNGLTADGRLK